jgi:hypothetical protein
LEEKDKILEEKDKVLEEKDKVIFDLAKTLKENGVSTEVIQQKTGLPKDVIDNL